MLLVPISFFSLLGRLCSGRFYIFTQQNVNLATCFTLRGHGAHIDLLWFLFLVGRFCPQMQKRFLLPLFRGTQRPNVSKYARSDWDGFLYVLEACLVNLELPWKLFICSDVLGELWLTRKFYVTIPSHPKVLGYPYGSGRKFEDMK